MEENEAFLTANSEQQCPFGWSAQRHLIYLHTPALPSAPVGTSLQPAMAPARPWPVPQPKFGFFCRKSSRTPHFPPQSFQSHCACRGGAQGSSGSGCTTRDFLPEGLSPQHPFLSLWPSGLCPAAGLPQARQRLASLLPAPSHTWRESAAQLLAHSARK